MASGTAFRRKEPARDVLNLYPNESPQKTKPKLYEAPPSSQLTRNNSPPSTPLLGDLPPELMRQVLLSLDLTSLGMLRRVNTAARRLIESLPEYSLLRKHASYTLRVMDATKCTSYFQIRWLFRELCHPRCRTCSDFGPFLYLPTITRSCLKCSIKLHQPQTWCFTLGSPEKISSQFRSSTPSRASGFNNAWLTSLRPEPSGYENMEAWRRWSKASGRVYRNVARRKNLRGRNGMKTSTEGLSAKHLVIGTFLRV